MHGETVEQSNLIISVEIYSRRTPTKITIWSIAHRNANEDMRQLRYDAVYIDICYLGLRFGPSLLSEHTATLTIPSGSLYTDLETSVQFTSYLAARGGRNQT